MSKIHFTNTRYKVNAGINIPECKARTKGLLDLDSSRLINKGYWGLVTCKKCLKYKPEHDLFPLPRE